MKLEFKKIPGGRVLGIYMTMMIQGVLHQAVCEDIRYIPCPDPEDIQPIIMIQPEDIVNRAELVKQLPLELKHALYPACPKCKSSEVVPIIYGSLRNGCDTDKKIKRGEAIFSGTCIMGDTSPMWHCKECGHQWGGN